MKLDAQVKNLGAKGIRGSRELSLDTAILNRKHPKEAKSTPFRASLTAESKGDSPGGLLKTLKEI